MGKLDIFITGVGGQGSLTASRILGEAAARAGLEVVVGEIHGMAQRGGVVESTVRVGTALGPIVSDGRADVLLGFEPVEAVRALAKAGPDTLAIVNTRCIVPFTVSLEGTEYPEVEAMLAEVRKIARRVIALDAAAEAQRAGSGQAINTVLLGVLAGAVELPFPVETLLEVIEESVPPKALEANRQAFERGREIGRRGAAG
jgi:indolepyruvate ferredoxin oxidoreductase beta subunit